MTPRTRAERALVTRRRMVVAGYRLFCERGYIGTTMNAIAAEADVAVQTVYYTFHTKAEILGEVLGAAVVGFDNWSGPPPEPVLIEDQLSSHTWWDEFESAPSSAAALSIFIRSGVDVLERAGPLVAALHGGSGIADVDAVFQLGERRRVDAYRAAVVSLAGKRGGLRRGMTIADATDVLVVLFSADVYQVFTHGRGWSRARCEQFFQETLAQQLLSPISGAR